MTPTSAELSSLTATVEDLIVRLAPIAGQYESQQRDDLVAEVHEIERLLQGGARRLAKLAAAPGA